MDGDSFGIGVIGGRSIVAERAVLPAIDASTHLRLAAICSLGGPVQSQWAGASVDSYQSVIDHPDVEAVYVPLPNGMHGEWVRRAADAGKHVLCEKPLAPTADEARALAAYCRAAGVLLAEAWMTPFDPRWAETLRLARDGAIGEVTSIASAFTFTIGPEAAANYRWDPAQGGGALLDVGIYCLGPAVELWGTEPARIDAVVTRHEGGVDARADILLEWPGGRTATATCSFIDEEEQSLLIGGPAGHLLLDGDAHTGGVRAVEILQRNVGSAPERHAVEAGDPYRAMLEAFARAATGKAEWPRSAEESANLLGLLERIDERSSVIVPEHDAISVRADTAHSSADEPFDLHIVRWQPPHREAHDAEPWLLVHGLASNARLWDGVAERLALAGHPVVAVDLRAHGRSEQPSSQGFSVANVADDLAQLIGALGWKRAAVAGQSWGGNVVLELAHRHPHLVHTLACVDGGTIQLAQGWPEWEDCKTALAPPPLAGMPLEQIQEWLAGSADDWPESGRQGTLHNFDISTNDEGTAVIAPWLAFDDHIQVLRGLWEHDPTAIYADVPTPTLFIGAVQGDDPSDDPSKQASIGEAVAAMPNARAAWFAPAHHDVHAQKPDEVAALLLDAVTLTDAPVVEGTPTPEEQP